MHVAHVGGHSGLLPHPQALAALLERLRARHADQVETCRARSLLEDTLCLAGFYPRSVHGQCRLNQTRDERDGDARHAASRAARPPRSWDYSDPWLCFKAETRRSQTETCAGCMVSCTTPTRSSPRASRSVSPLSLTENVSRVFLASYVLR